jgi:ribonucleoside-diphosphate reductase subunit M2
MSTGNLNTTQNTHEEISVLNNDGSTNTLNNDGSTNTLNNDGSTNTLNNDGSTNTLNNDGSTSTLNNDGSTNTLNNDDSTNTLNNDDSSSVTEEEEISCEDNFRLTIKPIDNKFDSIWKLYKKQQDCYWRAEEIDFSKDRDDFENVLDDDERHFVKMILSFFAASDGIVNMNLRERFLQEIKITEAQVAYGFQQMMENIHGEVYSDMLSNIIRDEAEKTQLLNGFKTIASIKAMTAWAMKWINSKEASIGKRIVAFAIVEGVFFSGAFASIFWLKKRRSRGKYFMNGLVKSNRFIARDEGMHTNFACILYAFVKNRLSYEEIKEIFDEAVALTTSFTQDAIRCDLIGMNVSLMNEYNKYVSDRLVVYLGYKKIYNATNPFIFMESIGFLNKDNFFEVRPDSYQSAHTETNTHAWTFTQLQSGTW